MIRKKIHNVILFTAISAFVLSTAACDEDSNSGDEIPNVTKPVLNAKLSDTSPETEIVFTWAQAGDAGRYVLTRTMVRDGITNESKIQWEWNTPLTITDSSCDPDTEYTYVLTAIVDGKYDSFRKDSDPVIVKTSASNKPALDFPTGVKVVTKEGEPNSLTLSWNPVQGATHYEVYRMEGVHYYFDDYFKLVEDTTETSHTYKYLRNGERYVFRIRALNDELQSPFSAKVEGKVAAAENTTMDKALLITSEAWRTFMTDADELWFKCSFEDGIVYTDGLSAQTFLLSIYSEDGKLLAENLTISPDGNPYTYPIDPRDPIPITVPRDITKDIKDFKAGTTYILKISKNPAYGNLDYLRIGLTIE